MRTTQQSSITLPIEMAESIRVEVASADRYTEVVVKCCEDSATFPNRGVSRDAVRAGLRLTLKRGRTMIAFFVDMARQEVAIVGIFHGGQDYESALREEGG